MPMLIKLICAFLFGYALADYNAERKANAAHPTHQPTQVTKPANPDLASSKHPRDQA